MDINPKSYKLKFLRKLIIQHNIKIWLDKRFHIQVVFPHYKRDLHPLKYWDIQLDDEINMRNFYFDNESLYNS